MSDVELVPPPIAEQSCRMCGLRRGRHDDDAEWVVDLPHNFRSRSQLRVERDADGTEHYSAPERPWGRRHVACEPTALAVVQAVTGVDVGDEDAARAVLARHGSALLAGDRQAVTRRPWGHVLPAEVDRVRVLALEAVAPAEPVSSPLGRCSICGTSTSLTWAVRPGLSWPDGTTAAACQTCEPLVVVSGGSVDREWTTTRALADLAEMRPVPSLRLGGHFGLRLASEAIGSGERHGAGFGRWEYHATALRKVKAAAQQALPEYLLDPAARAAGVEALLALRARASAEAARRESAARPGGDVDWT